MLWRVCVAFLLSELITTLTYVLMDNFCPCFLVYFREAMVKRLSPSILSELEKVPKLKFVADCFQYSSAGIMIISHFMTHIKKLNV